MVVVMVVVVVDGSGGGVDRVCVHVSDVVQGG